jgi:NADH-quinone oxidoreductase subunit L
MVAAKVTAVGTFILGLITAGMTAFYMFRLYFLTFEGECRADEETQSHLHESPPAMVIPLVVLGALALLGGLTGWPHFIAHVFEESSPSVANFMLYFEHWFDEVFRISNELRITNRFGSHAASYEAMVTALGTTAGLTGIGLAYFMYMKNTEIPGKIQERLRGLHEVLDNKYYVDEGYEKAFVWGSIKIGEGLTFFDKQILDGGLVNGAGAVMKSAGRMLRHIQSGNVQRYATYITLGVVLAMFAVMIMYA